MSTKVKVNCIRCKVPLFYVPKTLMKERMLLDLIKDVGVECVECATGKKNKVIKKKVKQTATARFANVRRGPRLDLGEDNFRSATEANFARVLKKAKVKYEFEKTKFSFEGYRTRPYTYLPDFEIKKGTKKWPAGWYEVKGYLDSKGRGKMKRFKKCYPEEAAKTIIILHKNKKAIEFFEKTGYRYVLYEDLVKEHAHTIPKWEK